MELVAFPVGIAALVHRIAVAVHVQDRRLLVVHEGEAQQDAAHKARAGIGIDPLGGHGALGPAVLDVLLRGSDDVCEVTYGPGGEGDAAVAVLRPVRELVGGGLFAVAGLGAHPHVQAALAGILHSHLNGDLFIEVLALAPGVARGQPDAARVGFAGEGQHDLHAVLRVEPAVAVKAGGGHDAGDIAAREILLRLGDLIPEQQVRAGLEGDRALRPGDEPVAGLLAVRVQAGGLHRQRHKAAVDQLHIHGDLSADAGALPQDRSAGEGEARGMGVIDVAVVDVPVPVQQLQHAGPGDAVRGDAMGLLEGLDRRFGPAAEVAVRLAAVIAGLVQRRLQRLDTVAPVAPPVHRGREFLLLLHAAAALAGAYREGAGEVGHGRYLLPVAELMAQAGQRLGPGHAVRGEALGLLRLLQGGLRAGAEDAVRRAILEDAEADQPLLQRLDRRALVAAPKRALGIEGLRLLPAAHLAGMLPLSGGMVRGLDGHRPLAPGVGLPVRIPGLLRAAYLAGAHLPALLRAGRLLRDLPAFPGMARRLGIPLGARAAVGTDVGRGTLVGAVLSGLLRLLHPVVLAVGIRAEGVRLGVLLAFVVPSAAHRRQRRHGHHAQQQEHDQSDSCDLPDFHAIPSLQRRVLQ